MHQPTVSDESNGPCETAKPGRALLREILGGCEGVNPDIVQIYTCMNSGKNDPDWSRAQHCLQL